MLFLKWQLKKLYYSKIEIALIALILAVVLFVIIFFANVIVTEEIPIEENAEDRARAIETYEKTAEVNKKTFEFFCGGERVNAFSYNSVNSEYQYRFTFLKVSEYCDALAREGLMEGEILFASGFFFSQAPNGEKSTSALPP